ncbi:MAG: N-acetylmuramoyl-L-alanine amidase [Verrucomicrobiota bacterium]
MRFALLLYFLAGAWRAGAEGSLENLQRTFLFGREYIRMTDWAKGNKVDLRWVGALKEKELRATNASTRMLLTMDSYKAQINGINFTLSLPIVLKKGSVYISAIDLQVSLQPLFFPEKMPTNAAIKTICLDPGHGGEDPGKLDGRMEEKKFTLLLSEEVERLLKKAGFNVVRTRTRDQTLRLQERPTIANRNEADLFISLHYNAAPKRAVEGVEVYCLTPAGTTSTSGGKSAPSYPGHAHDRRNTLLAYEMQKSLVKHLGVDDRSVKRSQFMVLLTAKMPAILIEGGFMTNPNEARRIYDPEYRKRMASAIVNGVLSYQKIVEK